MNNPTIVSAALSDKELQDSINRMVANFDKGLQTMLEHSNEYVGKIQESLQKIGNTNFGAKSSNDGGVAKQTKQHKDLTEAVTKETQKLQDLQQSLSGASDREQNFISQKERAANTIAQENELLSKQQSELAALKTQQQSLVDAEQRGAQAKQQNAAAIEKQRGAVKYYEEEIVSLQARLTSAQAKIDRFYEVQAKARESISSRLHAPSDQFIGYNDYERGKSVYSKTEQDVRSLIKALSELDNADKKHGFGDELRRAYMNLTPSQDMANVFKRQQEEISSYIKTLQEAKKGTKGETRANLDNQILAGKELLAIYKELGNAQNALNKTVQKEGLRDGGDVGGIKRDIEETQKAYGIAKQKLDELTQSSQQSTQASQQKAQIDAQVAAKEKEIAETKGRIAAATKEQSEADKNASQAAKEKANIQSQVANQEKQVAEAKKQLTTATQQHTAAEAKSSLTNKEQTMTLDQQQAAIRKVIDVQNKMFYARTMKLPTDQYDMQIAKLERIQAMLDRYRRGDVSFSPSQVSGLEKEERTLLQLINQVNTAQQQATQSAQRYTEELKKQAAEIRKMPEWKQGKDIIVPTPSGYDAVVNSQKKLSLEEQLLQVYKQQEGQESQLSRFENTQNALANERLRTEQAITQEIEKRGKKYVSPTINDDAYQFVRNAVARKLGIDTSNVINADAQYDSIKRVSSALKQLQDAYARMTNEERNSPIGKQMIRQMQELERQTQQLRKQMSRPINLKDALGGSEKTLDDIAYKMQRLASYRSGLNVDTQNKEIQQVNDEYNRLKKRMDEVMQKNQQMISSNNALGRSWNYMKNRLAFYFTVGASTQFVKNLIEVRSQYEMNERALGILINSAERGTQIFNELSQMALVSPYTLIELSAAAKQLTAYDVAAKDVVDTTRRLADMAAAVGIPIERLTYALGQVKAYGYLNARDARMFANAGIPLVKQLSDYYTELEGRLVSTADIYDRIKKKQIGYEEVMSTISKMTDEGGKFYDFQAKMAETLKVQLANLTLAWNNMLNAMGEESQGVLVGGISTLKQLFLHWKDIEHVLYELVIALGAYKAYQIITTRLIGATSASLDAQVLAMKRNNAAMLKKQALTRTLTADEMNQVTAQKMVTAADYQNALSGKQLTKQKALLLVALNKNNVQLKAAVVNMGLLTTQEVANITTGKALAIVFKSIGISMKNAALAMKAFAASMWPLLVVGAIYELLHAWDSYGEHVKEINKQAAEHAKEAFDNIKQYLESESTINTRQRAVYKEGNPLTDSESQKAWDEMREKIELSSSASNTFIAKLMRINNINERLSDGFGYLEEIQRVAGVMQTLEKDAVDVSSTSLGGLFGEGLKDDLTDFISAYQKYVSLNENLRQGGVGEEYFNKQKKALEEFRGEVEKTTTSLYNIASKEGFNTNEQREFFEREINEIAQAEQMGAKETRIFRMQAEKEYYTYARAQLVAQLEYQQGAQKAATEKRIKDLDNEFGKNKALQESFFTWLTEKQDHAVKTMLRGKTQEEIKQGEWLKGANAKWVEEITRKFSKEYGVSFDGLYKLVMDANTWHINIPVFFQTIGQPLTDVQQDYEVRTGKKFSSNPIIKDAKSQVEILDILKKKQKEVAAEMETAEKAGGKYWEANKERLKEENDALVADIHAYNALTDAEEKANKEKNKGSKKDPLLDALKQEISLVEKLQSDYDKLSKSGASHVDALETIRGAYGKTIRLLNAQLGKYGLPQLNISQLVTGKDPHKALEYFKQTLDTLVSKGLLTLERSKEIEAVVDKFTLSAKTYDLDMITKGLNNELGKLKDEYELAVELDANPELGNLFTKMFNINTSDFPKTIDDYMQRVQQEFDKLRQKRGFAEPLEVFKADDAKWESWGRNMGLVVDVLDENGKVIDKNTDALDKITPKFKEAQGVAKKWATDVVNNTKKLEYELAELNDKIAIKEKEQVRLHEQIENEKNEITKHYLQLTYQSNEKSIDELRAQALSLMPEYARVFNSIAEYSAGVSRRLQRDLMRVFDEAKYDSANKKWTLTGSDGKNTILNDTQYRKEREKLTKEIRKSQAPFKKIKEAFKPSDEKGVVDYAKGIELVSAEVQKLGSVASEVGNLAQIFGADEQTVEIINDVATSLNGVATAGQGISQIASGDYIGGAASVLSGITSIIGAWADNNNKRIDAEIKDSERAVKSLELAYIDLEHAINNAYGMATIGAQKTAIANKELQLAELKRQLTLEQSRDSKDKDEERIIELQKQIKELQYDIKDATDAIVNDLLGISSVGDAMESMMDAFVEALRNGEDAMATFDESVDEMIANMVKKMFTTKILQPWFEEQWNKIQDKINERAGEIPDKLDKVQSKVSEAKMADLNNNDSLVEALKVLGMDDEQIRLLNWFNEFGEFDHGFGRNARLRAAYEKLLKEAEQKEAEIQKELATATMPTTDDIRQYAELLRSGQPIVEENMQEVANFLRELGLMKDDASKNLSNLQAGISGVSEETAGAIEAYLNGVSQQVYLHSDLLTQIRDAVVGFNLDVSLGVQSQMLLQLQNSYQTQQAIQQILEGVLNPSGRAFSVELIN